MKGVTTSIEYNGKWMEECYVSVVVESPEPIDFQIGDWIEYRGDIFTINYDPTVLKQAFRRTVRNAFKYDGVKLNSVASELLDCSFLDYTLNDNKIHYSGLPSFSFYAANVSDLANRLQANLDRYSQQNNTPSWVVEVHPEYADKTDRNISIENQNCSQALALAKTEFGANFIIRGRKIIIGTEGVPAEHLFKMGKDHGLYQIERTAESDQQVVTRVRAYGNTTNLPYRYYHNLASNWQAAIKIQVEQQSDSGCLFSLENECEQYIDTSKAVSHGGVWYFPVTIGVYDYIASYVNSYLTVSNNTQATGYSLGLTKIERLEEAAFRSLKTGDLCLFECFDDSLPQKYRIRKATPDAIPNNMAVTRLMLPDFPLVTLDPYIDSANISALGVRETSLFFDGSNDLPDIHPTIEGMDASELKDAGIQTTADGALDELVDAQKVEDDGLGEVKGDDVIPESEYFEVTLKDIGFDINKQWTDETPVLSFKTGMLGGRDFEIVQSGSRKPYQNESGNWVFTLKRVYDDSLQLWFPYSGYNASVGDKFVLLHIDMPDVYIKAASERLKKAATEWLSKNDYSRSSYKPYVDNTFMALQHRYATRTPGVTSLHDTLREGDLLVFEDSDLGIDNASIFIDSLIIKEGDSPIPQYEITLREEKTVGTIQRIQNQIDSLKSGNGGGGYTSAQIKSLVALYGNSYFLSKLSNDVAKGKITFEQGLHSIDRITTDNGLYVGEWIPDLQGGAFYLDENGNVHLDADYVNIRKKLKAKSMEIQQELHVGGMQISSPAAMRCSRVERIDGGWRCYFIVEEDGRRIYNQFAVGDQARAQSYNLQESDGSLATVYWWRLVTAKGYIDAEGKQCSANQAVEGWIDVSETDCDILSDEPHADEVIIAYGNRFDPERQNVIVEASFGEGAPYIYQLSGVNSYDITGKVKTRISPNGNLFTGEFVVTTEKGEQELKDYITEYEIVPIINTIDGESVSFGCEVYKRQGVEGRTLLKLTSGSFISGGYVPVPTKLMLAINRSAIASGEKILLETSRRTLRPLMLKSGNGLLKFNDSETSNLTVKYRITTTKTTVDEDGIVSAERIAGEVKYFVFFEQGHSIPEDAVAIDMFLYRDDELVASAHRDITADRVKQETEYSTRFEITDKKIESVAKAVTTNGESITELSSKMTQTATEIRSEVERVSNEVTQAESLISQTADRLEFKVYSLENGFENLVSSMAWRSQGHVAIDNYLEYYSTDKSEILSPQFILKKNTEYTFNFWLGGTTNLGSAKIELVKRVSDGVASIDSATIIPEGYSPSGSATQRGKVSRYYVTFNSGDIVDGIVGYIRITAIPPVLTTNSSIVFVSRAVLVEGRETPEWGEETTGGLKGAGIDIESGKITLSSDNVEIVDSDGNSKTLISGGKIRAENIEVDGLKAREVLAGEKGKGTVEINSANGSGQMSVYNKSGDRTTVVSGINYQSVGDIFGATNSSPVYVETFPDRDTEAASSLKYHTGSYRDALDSYSIEDTEIGSNSFDVEISATGVPQLQFFLYAKSTPEGGIPGGWQEPSTGIAGVMASDGVATVKWRLEVYNPDDGENGISYVITSGEYTLRANKDKEKAVEKSQVFSADLSRSKIQLDAMSSIALRVVSDVSTQGADSYVRVGWKNLGVSIAPVKSVNHLFGNGISVGSSLNNHCTLFKDNNGYIHFYYKSGVVEAVLSPSKVSIKLNNNELLNK